MCALYVVCVCVMCVYCVRSVCVCVRFWWVLRGCQVGVLCVFCELCVSPVGVLAWHGVFVCAIWLLPVQCMMVLCVPYECALFV